MEGKSAGQSVLVTKPLQTADASLSSGQSEFDFSLLQLSILMFLINSMEFLNCVWPVDAL